MKGSAARRKALQPGHALAALLHGKQPRRRLSRGGRGAVWLAGLASASAARARCVQGHCRPTPALARPDIGRKPPGKRRGAGSRIGERDLLVASGEQNDNGHSGHGFDKAHVFQGCAAFGTDKGLVPCEGIPPAPLQPATRRSLRLVGLPNFGLVHLPQQFACVVLGDEAEFR